MMRRANRGEVTAYLRSIGAPAAIIQQSLGQYGENPNTNPVPPSGYRDGDVFNAATANALQARQYAPEQPFVANTQHAATYPFQIGTVQGSQSILPANSRRSLLLVQNQSTATNLFFNFAQDAGLNQGILLAPGVAVFFDYICPSDSVSVFFNNATAQPGLLCEVSPTG